MTYTTEQIRLNCLLMREARRGSRNICDYLIEQGADVNYKDAYNAGNTPLHMCAKFGNPGTAKLLIHYGAHVNIKNRNGNTPLSYSVSYRSSEVSDLLTQHGAVMKSGRQGI